MSRSLAGSSHLGQKVSHGDALFGLKKSGKMRKIGGDDAKLLEIVKILKKEEENNGNCCKIREKITTNRQSTQYNQGTRPNQKTN